MVYLKTRLLKKELLMTKTTIRHEIIGREREGGTYTS